MVDVSILIVNWNARDLLRKCLDRVQTTIHQASYEIIIIDNASTDGSQDLVKNDFPNARLIENTENVGFARANNQGIVISKGRYILLLNSDAFLEEGAVDQMVQAADSHPEAAFIGCKLLNQDGTLQASWARFPTLWSEALGQNFRDRALVDSRIGLYEVDSVGGACLLARVAAVQAVGSLDENFFMYSEEIDWCYRMMQAGWKILYLESAVAVHLGGGSASRASDTQLIRLYESKIQFFRKHYGRWQAALLRLVLILVNSIALARRSLRWVIDRHNADGGRLIRARMTLIQRLILPDGAGN